MKNCKYCGQDKPLDAFAKRSLSPDGLAYKCKACASAYHKEHYNSAPGYRESRIAAAARWGAENAEKVGQIKREYGVRHADRIRERSKATNRRLYYRDLEASRLAQRIAAQKRRARMASADGAIHPGFAKRLLAKAAGQCVYCEKQAELTLDHFTPVSKGGSGQWWNIAPCCQPCNSSKKDKHGPTWIEKRFGLDALVRIYWRLEELSAARLP